jgi:hypothetical protein
MFTKLNLTNIFFYKKLTAHNKAYTAMPPPIVFFRGAAALVYAGRFGHLKHDKAQQTRKIESIFKHKHASEIANPDQKLADILSYYEEEKKGKMRKLHYHKVNTAAILLQQLNAQQLCLDFDDFKQMITLLQEKV